MFAELLVGRNGQLPRLAHVPYPVRVLPPDYRRPQREQPASKQATRRAYPRVRIAVRGTRFAMAIKTRFVGPE